MRNPEELLESALAVIDQAFEAGATVMKPLFSGGHDSTCACFVAAQHQRFTGDVHHIDTGIGSLATRKHVEAVCKEEKWKLNVYKSNFSYEKFVRRLGFPGPGGHGWIYNKLKDRCIAAMVKGLPAVALITGCRSEESVRRMGHVEPVKFGETSKKTGKTTKKSRIWVAPCHDWTGEEQRAFMGAWALARNPVKESLLGMSGECFCGAFARPGELDMIREVCPDVAKEIERLTTIAEESGTPSKWGERPKKLVATPLFEMFETGPLCHGCDRKMAAAGLI